MPITLPDIERAQDRRVLFGADDLISERCADLLPEGDRVVLRLFRSDPPSSCRQLAALLNVSPGTISRRLARIRRRLGDPVVRCLATRGHMLSTRVFDIARALFAAGQPIRLIARAFNTDTREIAGIKHYLQGWARSQFRSAE